MKELDSSEVKRIHGGDLSLVLDNLNFIGESILLGSFVGFLISPATTPNAIIFSGIVSGLCATLLY